MKIHLKIAMALGLFAPLALYAVQPVSAQEGQDEKTALQESMGVLKKGQRSLKKLIADPAANKDTIMRSLTGMEAAAMTAMAQKPPAEMGVAEADQALWHVRYKRKITSLLDSILAMEEATLNGDAKALGEAYAQLGSVKQAGHSGFRDL